MEDPGESRRALPRDVLVPYGGARASAGVVRYAAAFTAAIGGTLHVLRVASDRHVQRVAEGVTGGGLEAALAFCRRRAEAAFDDLRRGLDPEEEVLFELEVAETVVGGVQRYVEANGIDLVVLRPGRRPDSSRRDLGARLSEDRRLDVLFVKGLTPFPWPNGTVVVPIDREPGALRCVRRAVALCDPLGGELRLVHVLTPGEEEPGEEVIRNLAAAEALAAEASVRATRVVRTAPTPEAGIVTCAVVSGADLVVARHGRRTIWGSVADRANRQSCHDVYLVGEGSE